jgi:hypothetical protein
MWRNHTESKDNDKGKEVEVGGLGLSQARLIMQCKKANQMRKIK